VGYRCGRFAGWVGEDGPHDLTRQALVAVLFPGTDQDGVRNDLLADITRSDESLEVKFWPVQNLDNLDMHPSIRRRISHYLAGRSEAFIA
jgi:hypothetical protein